MERDRRKHSPTRAGAHQSAVDCLVWRKPRCTSWEGFEAKAVRPVLKKFPKRGLSKVRSQARQGGCSRWGRPVLLEGREKAERGVGGSTITAGQTCMSFAL